MPDWWCVIRNRCKAASVNLQCLTVDFMLCTLCSSQEIWLVCMWNAFVKKKKVFFRRLFFFSEWILPSAFKSIKNWYDNEYVTIGPLNGHSGSSKCNRTNAWKKSIDNKIEENVRVCEMRNQQIFIHLTSNQNCSLIHIHLCNSKCQTRNTWIFFIQPIRIQYEFKHGVVNRNISPSSKMEWIIINN